MTALCMAVSQCALPIALFCIFIIHEVYSLDVLSDEHVVRTRIIPG